MEKELSNIPYEELLRSRILLFGGLSGIAIGIGYIVITVACVIAGFPLPTDATAWVDYLNGKTLIWWIIIWLSIITNILYIPFAYGMYELLKKTHAGMLLVSFSLFALFVVLELSITWSKYPAIIDLVSKYHLSTDSELKLIYLAAIETMSSEFQTVVTSFYMIFIPSIATILASIALFQTKISNRLIAIIGLISGSCNAISSMGGFIYKPLGNLVVLGSFLILFWFMGIGIALLKQRSNLILELNTKYLGDKI